MFAAFQLAAPPSRPYEFRDRIMAYYGPISLVLLPAWWLVLIALGFALIFWVLGEPIGDAIITSGSSLLTLGFLRPPTQFGEIIAFVEAAIGLALVALLISYLPTIYSAFSRRELLVNLLEVRADSPPSPVVMITRMHRLSGLDALHDLWERWEQWFAEVEETHSSLPVLVFYRSQQHDHSWVNAVGGGHGHGRADALGGGGAVGRPGRPHDPRRLHRAPPDRDLLPDRLRPPSRPDGRHQHLPRAVRRGPRRCWRRPACRWSRTATRRGATSTAGG